MKRTKSYSSGDASAGGMSSNTSQTSPSPAPSSATANANKRRRNNPDECCLTCKLRKVKCSGKSSNHPCDNCTRLKLTCSFTVPANGAQAVDKVARITPTGVVTEAGTLRKRAQRACLQCHTHKTKCSGDLPRCRRCDSNDMACEYMPSKRKFASAPGQASHTPPTLRAISTTPSDEVSQRSHSESKEPTSSDIAFTTSPKFDTQLFKRDVILKHVEVYFDRIFHMPCMGFLHPPTVYRLIEEDKLPPTLAAGICSITADFVCPGSAGRSFAVRCNEQLELDALRNFASLTREQLTYHVLAAVYNWMSGSLGRVWMWTATASRLIRCLQMNYESEPRSTPEAHAEQEIQRRCVWQIYIIDHFLSGGHDEHLLLPSSSIHIRLPCADEVFRDGGPSVMEFLEGNPSIPPNVNNYSLDACHVRLLTIRSEVLRTTKKFMDSSQSSLSDPMRSEEFMNHVNQFQIALHRFSESLPNSLKLSIANVDAHVLRPDRTSFTMLHTWFCQTHIELYSFSLQALKEHKVNESSGNVSAGFFSRSHEEFLLRSRQQAVAYAVCLAQTWDYSIYNIKKASTPMNQGLVTVDWMVGACAVDVVEVLLIARKHRLYKDLRGNTSAQLCYSRPIDDSLMAILVASISSLVGSLVRFLPRVDHYKQTIQTKIREYDEWTRTNTQSINVGLDGGPAESIPNLPGPDNMLPTQQLDFNVLPQGSTGQTSLSDQFLRKRPVLPHEKMPDRAVGAANSQITEPPSDLPYCLRQARGSPEDGPFAPPTGANYPLPQDYIHTEHQPPQFYPSIPVNLDPSQVFDTSMRPAISTEVPEQQAMAFGQYPPQDSIQTPTVPSHGDNIFMAYGTSYPFQSADFAGQWIQHGQRNPHTYSE